MPENKGAKRILIVEDSKDMREIYRTFFKNHSGEYAIEIEGDAQAALQRIKNTSPDLIVLDIIMEPMTGEAFLVHARHNKTTQDTPIVIVSVLSESILKGISRHKNLEFLQKPITEVQLMGAIKKKIG
ncbi:MAG: response regulator [Proteobacteria bacterium]|nr:response regulator [Pseudomonadota bacterium]